MRFVWTGVIILPLLISGLSRPLCAQDLVAEAMKSFPAGTIHIEYSSPATLSQLSNYKTLSQHYVGPQLKKLEASLAGLGIRTEDVNHLVLGWSTGSSEADFYGLASVQFDPAQLAASASAAGISPDSIGGKTAYCLGAGLETPCVVILGPDEGAVGTLRLLSEIMDVRSGARPGLDSNSPLAKAIQGSRTSAPIWGVAVGKAVAGWFKGWMPSQQRVQMDWAQVLQGVDALAYSVQPADNVHLKLKFTCASQDAAGSLREVLEGLKLAQQLTWQSQNPNVPNPFQAMEVAQSGNQIGIDLTASYSQLTAASAGGGAGQ